MQCLNISVSIELKLEKSVFFKFTQNEKSCFIPFISFGQYAADNDTLVINVYPLPPYIAVNSGKFISYNEISPLNTPVALDILFNFGA
jgi:hypothetical protein